MKTTSSERRLHPLSILLDGLRVLPGAALPLLVLVFTKGGDAAPYVLAGVGAVAAVALVASVLRYLRFSYRYEPRDLVVRSGVFVRNERRIPYVRIQNLDAAQNPLHRLFGVVAVYVQTGGGAEPEASLRVLPLAGLDEMRTRVLAAGGRADEGLPGTSGDHVGAGETYGPDIAGEDTAAMGAGAGGLAGEEKVPPGADRSTQRSGPAARRTLLQLEPGDLVLAGFIENRGMVLIAGALALLEQTGLSGRVIERFFQEQDTALRDLTARWLGGVEVPVLQGALYLTAAILGVLLFIRLLSTVWAVVRLYGFRLDRVGDELHTQYGLFTRVSATIPLRRIQTVIVREGMVHRLLARRSVAVVTAGGLGLGTDMPVREPIAPIIRADLLPALLHELQPGLDLAAIEWRAVHPRAFGRMVRATTYIPIAGGLITFSLVREWAIAVFLLLTAHILIRAWMRARTLGWSLTRDSVVARDGALTHTIRVARFNRLQVAALVRTPFDLRTGMATIRADTAGWRGGLGIPYLPFHAAAGLHDELVARAASSTFHWS
jgi:putative membrane protein